MTTMSKIDIDKIVVERKVIETTDNFVKQEVVMSYIDEDTNSQTALAELRTVDVTNVDDKAQDERMMQRFLKQLQANYGTR